MSEQTEIKESAEASKSAVEPVVSVPDKFSKEGVVCSFCGTFNTHGECGTYDVWVPTCKECGMSTEAH